MKSETSASKGNYCKLHTSKNQMVNYKGCIF